MKREDGYCDECGAECDVAWLRLDGSAVCETCAVAGQTLSVRTPTKKEARDDGR